MASKIFTKDRLNSVGYGAGLGGFMSYQAHKDDKDGKFKNVLKGAALGGLAGGVLHGLGGSKKAKGSTGGGKAGGSTGGRGPNGGGTGGGNGGRSYGGNRNYNSGGAASNKFSSEFDGLSDINEAKKRYRKLSRIHHPDHGGSTADMQDLNNAYEAFKKKYGM